MFDKPQSDTTALPEGNAEGAEAPDEEKETITGHPIMDKPTALESGRLRGADAPMQIQKQEVLPQTDVSQPPAELSGPVLQTKRSHKKLWFVVFVIIIALAGTMGVWIYILNRPISSEEAEDVATVNQAEPEETTPAAPLQPVDTDKDGLEDAEEQRMGTDSTMPDTDSDGLTDKEEIALWNTDPLDPDTDKDGFSDGEEVDNGYNPAGQGRLFDINDIDL